MSLSENRQNHIYNYDLLRIFAIMMVLFNHTRTFGYELCTVTAEPFSYWISISEAVLCKCGVPLFMMVSGALLLKKYESVKDVLLNRVIPFSIIYFSMFFLQYVRLIHAGAYTSFTVKQYIGFLLGENPILPYWFLRTYLIYLITLPILRLVAQHMTNDVFWLLIAMEGVISGFHLIGIIASIPNTYTVPFHDSFIVYPLFGHWLSRNRIRITKKKAGILFLTIIIAVLFTHFRNQVSGFQEASFSPFVWIITVLIFESVTSIPFSKDHPVLLKAGDCVFGIYLIEDIVRNRLEFIIPLLSSKVSEIGAANAFVISVFFVGLIIVMIGKRIPVIRFFLK